MLRTIILSIFISLYLISNAYCWVIENYNVDIIIEPEGDLKITEKLTVDFGMEKKHGIYRDIPLDFKDPAGKSHKIEIRDIFVSDEMLNPYKIKISKSGNNLRIRIGDPNIYVSGIKNYLIHYRVKYALYSLGNIDELYWNSIGTGWAVPIKGGIITVILPFDNSHIQYACYTGAFGSIAKNCEAKKEENIVIFKLKKSLSPHEGMTVAVGWPTGMIKIRTGPPLWKNPWLYLCIYIPCLFIFLFWLWWKKGRDVGGKGIIQVQYEPPNDITPIEAGTLIDEKTDTRDIVAEIIDLARRGYIKIIETEEERFLFGKKREYIFEKIKDFDSSLQSKEFDLQILNALFEGGKRKKLTDLKKKFYSAIPEITKSVFSSLTTKGFFTANPLSVKSSYTILGVIILILTIFGSVSLGIFLINFVPLLVGGIITAISIFILGQFMPRKTRNGSIMKEYLKGYEEFISRVEKNIIEKLFPPDKIPEVFEITLPYAIAFGEAEKWANAFEGLFIQPPNWYQSRGTFSPSVFAYSLDRFTSEASQILSSAPRSSGGGSSGGGFSGGGGGGGGGGSW